MPSGPGDKRPNDDRYSLSNSLSSVTISPEASDISLRLRVFLYLAETKLASVQLLSALWICEGMSLAFVSICLSLAVSLLLSILS